MFRFEFFKKDIGITSKHGHNETCVCVCWRESFWFLSLTYIITSYTVRKIFSQMDLRAKFNPHKKVYQIIQGASIHFPLVYFNRLIRLMKVAQSKIAWKKSYSSLFSVCLSEDSKHSQ